MKGIGGVLNVDFMVKILPAQGFEPATFFKKSTFYKIKFSAQRGTLKKNLNYSIYITAFMTQL